MNPISKEAYDILYNIVLEDTSLLVGIEYDKLFKKNKKVLEIQNYKKLVGFNIQSGGFLISINDVTDREDHYHFMMELKESGVIRDYIALMLLKETRKVSDLYQPVNWYRLEPVHNPNGRHQPLTVLGDEVAQMKTFGELVCKYSRSVWDI